MYCPTRILVLILGSSLYFSAAPLCAQGAPPPLTAPEPAIPAPTPSGPTVALPEIAQPQAAPAGGSSCDKDFSKLANARVAQIAALNRLSKGGKGKMDPIAACSKLQGLAGIEARMVAYVEKNQDWCGIPDNVVGNIKKGRQNTVAFAGKACGAAANFRKMLAQRNVQRRSAASSGGSQPGPQVQRLPAGPL